MCGKFELDKPSAEILAYYGVQTRVATRLEGVSLPMREAPIIIRDRLGVGLWNWPMKRAGKPMINIRVETAAQKPSFKDTWAADHRCIAPATSFFEGPYRCFVEEAALFGLCGLWTHGPDQQVHFAILTQEATPAMAVIEPRMPVIATLEHTQNWLFGGVLPPPPSIRIKDLAALPLVI